MYGNSCLVATKDKGSGGTKYTIDYYSSRITYMDKFWQNNIFIKPHNNKKKFKF